MPAMRAKMRVASVSPWKDTEKPDSPTLSESLVFEAVGKSGLYPADGSDEDNSYAKWTPSGRVQLSVTNPALFGKFEVGETYYLDFTKAE